jgi:rhodanese-related sulfurtransferase
MNIVKKISSKEAWSFLERELEAVLVDVRTPQEWHSIGRPDLSLIKKEVAFISWGVFVENNQESDFISTLQKLVKDKNIPVLFICRSGIRSDSAARCAIENGYKECFNVIDGFEGNALDSRGWRRNLLPIIKGSI